MSKSYKESKVSVQKGKIDCARPEVKMPYPGRAQERLPTMRQMNQAEKSVERYEQFQDLVDGGTLHYEEPKL